MKVETGVPYQYGARRHERTLPSIRDGSQGYKTTNKNKPSNKNGTSVDALALAELPVRRRALDFHLDEALDLLSMPREADHFSEPRFRALRKLPGSCSGPLSYPASTGIDGVHVGNSPGPSELQGG